jgi:hypothetical protein
VPDFLASLDLGQSGDYTALAILKRYLVLSGDGLPVRNHKEQTTYKYAIVALERYPFGTSYPTVVAHVSAFLRRPELQPAPRLVIDATGVGRAVVDMFLDDIRGSFEVHPLTITAGDTVRRDAWFPGVWGYWVPKNELVSSVQAGLGTCRLKVAPGLKEAETLKRELLDFKVKVTASANEKFNARDGAHDDLVLAVAMAVWLAERREVLYRSEREDDPDRLALTAERKEEERAEKEALERQERADKERRQKEWMSPDNDALWTRIG